MGEILPNLLCYTSTVLSVPNHWAHLVEFLEIMGKVGVIVLSTIYQRNLIVLLKYFFILLALMAQYKGDSVH